jgi:DNA replication licensing factor MCM3
VTVGAPYPQFTHQSRRTLATFRVHSLPAAAGFRQAAKDRATVITARSLETLIRLSSAHAKLRLSRHVTEEDVEVVAGIMNYALYADAQVR